MNAVKCGLREHKRQICDTTRNFVSFMQFQAISGLAKHKQNLKASLKK